MKWDPTLNVDPLRSFCNSGYGTHHWYEFLYDAQSETGAAMNGDVIPLHFVEALRGDDDTLMPDGVIVDTGAFGIFETRDTRDNISGGGSGSGCFIDALKHPLP